MDQTVKIKYCGMGKRRISWISKDKQFSYNLTPGKILELSRYDASIAQNLAHFILVPEEKLTIDCPENIFGEYETMPQSDGKETQDNSITDIEYLNSLTKASLVEICKSNNLPYSGTKKVLIERILSNK